MQKGAMFGLDARIALAIFGALSVVSGAALYQAIEQSKAVAEITKFNEIGKAFDAFYLDTGTIPSHANDNPMDNYFYILKTSEFIDDPSIIGWNGPYIDYTSSGASAMYNHRGDVVRLMILTDEDWSSWLSGKATSGKDAYIWVRYYNTNGVISESIKHKIDENIDNSDGPSKGSIRWDATSLAYKYSRTQNPND